MKQEIIVLFHGSRSGESLEAIAAITDAIRSRGRCARVSAAFLQQGRPSLSAAISSSADAGVSMITIVPFFFQLGTHVTRDIPALLEQERLRYPHLDIAVTAAIGTHPLMVDAALDLVHRLRGETS